MKIFFAETSQKLFIHLGLHEIKQSNKIVEFIEHNWTKIFQTIWDYLPYMEENKIVSVDFRKILIQLNIAFY